MLTVGTVTFSLDAVTGVPTFGGSGLARELAEADAISKGLTAAIPTEASSGDGGYARSLLATDAEKTKFDLEQAEGIRKRRESALMSRQFVLEDVCRQSRVYATAILTHIVNNAQVTLSGVAARVTSQSLGRTPNPNDVNTPIQAPSAPVDVPLTGTGSVQ
jgi:hypothetical protein